MQFGLGGFSRGFRGSKKQIKKAASKGLLHLLVFALVTQLVLPTQHMAIAAPADENRPNPEEDVPREYNQQADPADNIPPVPSNANYETEATSAAAIPPSLRRLIEEVKQGKIRTADPNRVSQQVLEIVDRPGFITRAFRTAIRQQAVRPNRTIDLKDSNIARPPVPISDFVDQVEVFYEKPSNKLVFSALGGTVRQSLLDADLAAAPIVDPEVVLSVKTTGRETRSEINYQLDLMPVDEFVGDAAAKGFGFYAPLNFYPVLNFSLQRDMKISKIEFYGPKSARVYETLLGVDLPDIIDTGDVIVTVLQNGEERRLWLSRNSLYLSLENCIKHTAVLTYIRVPTPEVYSLLLEMFEGRAEELAAVIASLQQDVDADGNWKVDRAISAQRLRDGGNAWSIRNARRLPGKDESGNPILGKSTLAKKAERPRQEHVLSEPDGNWEVLRQRLQSAQKANPNIKFTATTTSYAQAAISAAVKHDKQVQARRWGYWKRFQAVKKQILTPAKMILLGLTLAAGTFVASPDSEPFPFLTAVGSRIYAYAAEEGVAAEQKGAMGPAAVNAVTSPINNAASFLANQAYSSDPKAALNVVSWATTLSFYVAFLPMIYLASYAFHRFVKGESTRLAWWPMSQLVFTDMLTIFAWMNRSAQEGFWTAMRQNNLYYALNAGIDPNTTRKAWNSPLAPQATIDANASALSQNLDRSRQLRLIASRATALAIVAKHTGIDPGTLEMSGSAGDMTQFLKLLMKDGNTARTWYLTTSKLNEILNADKSEVLSLDPKETDAMVEAYMGQANRLIESAALLDRQNYVQTACESEKASSDCGKFSTVGFLRSLAQRSAAWVNQNCLHWAFFGMPGVNVFHANRGRKVGLDATRIAGTQVGVDYPLSTLVWAGKSPEDFSIQPALPFFGTARVFAGQAEQATAWHAGSQIDAMENVKELSKRDPYRPLESFYFDPDMGGIAREQTLDEGLANMLRSRTDPDSKSWFFYWQNYLKNVYKFFQAKLILSGVPLAIGFAMSKDVKELWDTPSWVAVPVLAAFTAAWLWLIKYTIVPSQTASGSWVVSPNYAVLWSGVVMATQDARAPVASNREALMDAIAFLSSHRPENYQRGVREVRALFAKHHLPIPTRFNPPSAEFDFELKEAFLAWIKETEAIPGATKESTFLDVIILNLGVGALGTTALYDSLSKSLNAGEAEPILSAAYALRWYVIAFGTAAAGAWASSKLAPYWKDVHGATDEALNRIAGVRDTVKRGCAGAITAVVGDGGEPMTDKINLE